MSTSVNPDLRTGGFRDAVLREEGDLPFVILPDSTELQLLQVDLVSGVWIVRTHFPPGLTLQTHRHTGHVYAFTLSGSWYYLETPEHVNRAGSYLYEPAGSVHTLHVPDTNDGITDAWFVIHGANLNLDAAGEIEHFVDAHTVLSYYRHVARKLPGAEDPPVVVIGE